MYSEGRCISVEDTGLDIDSLTGLSEDVFPDKPFLKEFVLKPLISAEEFQKRLLAAGFFGALLTEEGYVSFAVTEKRTKAEADALVKAVREG